MPSNLPSSESSMWQLQSKATHPLMAWLWIVTQVSWLCLSPVYKDTGTGWSNIHQKVEREDKQKQKCHRLRGLRGARTAHKLYKYLESLIMFRVRMFLGWTIAGKMYTYCDTCLSCTQRFNNTFGLLAPAPLNHSFCWK